MPQTKIKSGIYREKDGRADGDLIHDLLTATKALSYLKMLNNKKVRKTEFFQSREARALGNLTVALYPISVLNPILLPVEVQRLENPSVSPEC